MRSSLWADLLATAVVSAVIGIAIYGEVRLIPKDCNSSLNSFMACRVAPTMDGKPARPKFAH